MNLKPNTVLYLLQIDLIRPYKKKDSLNNKKGCFVCKKLFESDDLIGQAQWRNCEKSSCNNWYCFHCIPVSESNNQFEYCLTCV